MSQYLATCGFIWMTEKQIKKADLGKYKNKPVPFLRLIGVETMYIPSTSRGNNYNVKK